MSLVVDVLKNDVEDFWDVKLKGELDIYSVSAFKEKLDKAIDEDAKDLKIDMKDLMYIDSTGLGVLIGKLKRLKPYKKGIYIRNARKNVKHVFNITGLDKIFEMEE